MMKIDSFKPSLVPAAVGVVGGKVGVGLDDDMSDGMQCSDHPYRTNPGGICAFCLQEKLGKLVSSSLPLPIRGSSSSPSSPSVGSENNVSCGSGGNNAPTAPSNAISIGAGSTSKTVNFNANGVDCHYHDTRRARIPFLLAKKKKKVVTVGGAEYNRSNDVVFKRSKSTTAPRRGQFLVDGDDGADFSPRKRGGGFWSFLYYHAPSSSKSHAPRKVENSNSKGITTTGGGNLGANATILEEDESPNSDTTSFERKVSRSRSVGCGSRSFSGDFFERISTGFGDCTLRRVESQRENKSSKVSTNGNSSHRNGAGVDHHCIKERVKCGGLFSGFMMNSSSSSSSSSSYLVSSSADELTRKPTPAAGPLISGGRSRTWTWAFASPMRAFKPSNSKDRKRSIIRQATESNPSPDLNAIPSLLAVRS
ncbi:uncharacterized protein LOC120092831 [Benincasa hispida]|uniref:uncharacterized protein LOC120092831 n=1 Tax=Benincasa hispida TaxID=102211 RepID=UPI0018FF98F0|nr:uncharacterized protein LOC120092831 [Benincasa hispida]